MIRTALALKREGLPNPWRLAFQVCVLWKFIPRRVYMLSDRDGFMYDPTILQWVWRTHVLWQDMREIERQKAKAA